MIDKLSYEKPDSFNGRERWIRYHFSAKGQLCRSDDTEKLRSFKGIIEHSGHKVGKEVYTIEYDEGLDGSYTLGWIVIFDVERLFKEVFNERESVIPEKEEERNSGDIMRLFLQNLKEKGIEYAEDFINMD